MILRYLRAYRTPVMLGVACLLLTNGLMLVIPWLLKSVIEGLDTGTTPRQVAYYALAISAIALTLTVSRTWSRFFILGTSRRIVCDIRHALFAHLQTLPASFYARHRTGEIMSRAVNDLRLIRSLFGPGVLNVVNVALLYTVGLALMAMLDPALTAVSIVPYVFVLTGVARVSRSIHHHSNRVQEQLAEISTKTQESLSGINLVKAYGREESEVDEFVALSREYRARSLSLALSRGLVVTLMGALGGASTIIVLYLGGRHVVEQSLSLGGFVAFTSYLAILTGPTIMMGWILGVFQRGLGAIRRVEEIHAESSDLPGDSLPAHAPRPSILGAVTCRKLTFSYPGGPTVLEAIDLDVPSGTTVGIVGRVGSGKTTLVHLLAGVYPVPAGTLLVDGHDINTLPTAWLRRHVAIVPQETFLFSRTIAENIALGAPSTPRARLEEVARVAQITQDFPALPHGLETLVGERGVTLSGGQRQRVALARALLLDPRILILDDALSSVDAHTEEAILVGLRTYMRSRTTFLITHRVPTVLSADQIVVLEAGRVVERGSVRELLSRDGPFARMHRQQQIEKELDAL